MKIAIMQPTYLPWSGYFNLIAETAVFVFLDNVQFSHRSWQQRNRIIVNAQPHYLTVPVLGAGRVPQPICRMQIDGSQNWRHKHVQTLQRAYAKHPHGREVAALVEAVLAGGEERLSAVNIGLIRSLCAAMGMEPVFHQASELNITAPRSEHLLAICRHFGAESYLSPQGSREYIQSDGVFAASEVKVVYQNFVPRPYPQRGVQEFISHMSIVDLLANVGFEEGRKYVQPNAG